MFQQSYTTVRLKKKFITREDKTDIIPTNFVDIKELEDFIKVNPKIFEETFRRCLSISDKEHTDSLYGFYGKLLGVYIDQDEEKLYPNGNYPPNECSEDEITQMVDDLCNGSWDENDDNFLPENNNVDEQDNKNSYNNNCVDNIPNKETNVLPGEHSIIEGVTNDCQMNPDNQCTVLEEPNKDINISTKPSQEKYSKIKGGTNDSQMNSDSQCIILEKNNKDIELSANVSKDENEKNLIITNNIQMVPDNQYIVLEEHNKVIDLSPNVSKEETTSYSNVTNDCQMDFNNQCTVLGRHCEGLTCLDCQSENNNENCELVKNYPNGINDYLNVYNKNMIVEKKKVEYETSYSVLNSNIIQAKKIKYSYDGLTYICHEKDDESKYYIAFSKKDIEKGIENLKKVGNKYGILSTDYQYSDMNIVVHRRGIVILYKSASAFIPTLIKKRNIYFVMAYNNYTDCEKEEFANSIDIKINKKHSFIAKINRKIWEYLNDMKTAFNDAPKEIKCDDDRVFAKYFLDALCKKERCRKPSIITMAEFFNFNLFYDISKELPRYKIKLALLMVQYFLINVNPNANSKLRYIFIISHNFKIRDWIETMSKVKNLKDVIYTNGVETSIDRMIENLIMTRLDSIHNEKDQKDVYNNLVAYAKCLLEAYFNL
uniref:RING-type domain-containing protein n=1 Tax=Parastrongyloides trichosuri TaxID=131310 RepID=A0A0N4Z9K3_PARTI